MRTALVSALFPCFLSIVAGCSDHRASVDRVEITREPGGAKLVLLVGPDEFPLLETFALYDETMTASCLSTGSQPHGVILTALIHQDPSRGPDVITITRK